MRPFPSLSSKLVSIGAAMLVVALASNGLTLWVTWHLEGGGAAVNEAGRMRMQIWRLSSAAQSGLPEAQLRDLVQTFDGSLKLLREGDAGRPLFVPWDDKVREQFDAVSLLWRAQREQWLAQPPPTSQIAMQDAARFVDAIDKLVSSIERQLSRLTAVLNLFQFVMMVLAIGGAVVMLYTGYLFVINPLEQLRLGLKRVEAGEFSTRVEVDTDDEFGQVGASFNRMAATLQSLYQGLEFQVEAKTRHIADQHARLRALYEVSAFLAQANSLEELSQGFAQRVREVLHADAAALRLTDAGNYLLAAGDRLPESLQLQEHSLPAGTCACGNLQPDSLTRVVPIRPQDCAAERPCAALGFQAVITVPIRLQQRLLGELDLLYREPVLLGPDQTGLLDALASHLASALEGLRAKALEREAAVAQERTLLAHELHDSIAQSLAFLKIQLQLLRGAVQRQQPGQVEQALEELDGGLRESIGDVRELLVHFRTRTNTDDIEPALHQTLQKFQQQSGVSTQLDIQGEGLPLAPDVQVQVLHVLLEALSNVRKHARASQVRLQVRKGQVWRFAVRDDGQGFDASQQPDDTHVGMKIMRERAARIGAQVTVETVPGQGTTVSLTLCPMSAEPGQTQGAEVVDLGF